MGDFVRGLEFEPSMLGQQDLAGDGRWGDKCLAFNVQADLEASAVDGLEAMVAVLNAALPGQHVIPSDALHVSVLNLVHSRSSMPDSEKHGLWAANRQRWLRVIDDVSRATAPFKVSFDQVVLAPTGVLVVATDSPEMVSFRERLGAALDLGGTTPALCHVTIMRFGRNVPEIAAVRRVLHSLPVRVVTGVTAIRTVRELTYPSLERATVRRHELLEPAAANASADRDQGWP